MKRLALDSSDPHAVTDSIREFLKETQAVYQGMLDQVPEAFKQQVKALKDKIDSTLTQLNSRQSDPAADAAASTQKTLLSTIDHLQDVIAGTMEALNKLAAEFSPKVTALQALQGRIDKHELLEATEVETRVKQASEDAKKAEREHLKLLNSRRTVLAQADVPLPVEDELLAGDDKAFETLKTRVTDRSKKLRDLGQLQVLNAAEITDLVYGPEVQFNCVVKAIENATKKGGGADPLLGNPGRDSNDKKARKLCIA